MKVLYVSSEALPFASTGGLGDVIGSLPAAVKAKNAEEYDVRAVIPMYPVIKEKFASEIKFEGECTIPLSWRNQYCGIWSAERRGVKYYFLDNEFYFKREKFYGSYDDGERFAFFGKAVLELLRVIDFYPDVLHANDWQSALSVIYLKRKYGMIPGYDRIKTVYTIHNIEYQGMYGFEILGDVFDLAEYDRSIVEYNGCVNLCKGAITVSDAVTTVSARYAREIMTPFYSHGLSGVLNGCAGKVSGIVNGIDTDYYDPKTDPAIKYHYSADSLQFKTRNKTELQTMCGLEVGRDIPVVAMISRLADHKGFDLICRVIEEMITVDNIEFVLLGTGDAVLENFFRSLAAKYPNRMCAMIEFNKDLSKKIYAGADMFLMPSKSEPCGLSQMIAARYGAVPIVRECGGLADTIEAYNKFEGTGNGFSFANYNAHEMMGVVREAVELYKNRKEWNRLVRRAMNTDFSWNVSAEKYIDLYESLID